MRELRNQFRVHLPTRKRLDTIIARADMIIASASPFSPALGLARSLLALGTLGTLLFTAQDQLFFQSSNYPTGVVCSGTVTNLSLFCLAEGSLGLGRLVACITLALVALGFAPALTAFPHWWVTWSLYNSSPIPDGGDHVAGAITLLLMPIVILDRRRWHWSVDLNYESRPFLAKVIAYTFLVLIWIQVASIYAHAAIAKLGVEEWANGTALWYWIQDPTFAPGEPMSTLLLAATGTFAGVFLLTYGSLTLEFSLMFGIVAPQRVRGALWLLGITFHAGIGVVFGLWSFFCSMAAALTLYLIRPHLPATTDPAADQRPESHRSDKEGNNVPHLVSAS